MSFNLVTMPWIPVLLENGRQAEVSLVELLKTWKSLPAIQAENPPTTLAIYRFLLAILHWVYQGPKNIDDWEDIQLDNGQQAITTLQAQAEYFDLLHPDRPFMQDRALTIDKAVPIYAIHRMSTSTVFSHEHEFSGYSISLPEAARMLVRLQFVDITSLRAFYPTITKGNRSAVNTPTINGAAVLVQGKNLRETLLFNLVQLPESSSEPDLPAWETGYAGLPQKTVPAGYISYSAYPWRRLNLFFNGDSAEPMLHKRADQIAITMGNSFPDGVSIQQWESSLAFREDRPVRLSLERQFWRDAHSFLQSVENNHRPRVIDWLAQLKFAKLVDDVVHLQVFGMCANQAKPLDWTIEQFSAPLIYLTDQDLWQTMKKAIDRAEEHRTVFGGYIGSPYHALAVVLKNNDASGLAKSLAGESDYWAALDQPFRRFLEELPQDSRIVPGFGTIYGGEKLTKWLETVQNAARIAFTRSIASIRNYEARAKALQALEWKLADLRLSKEERDDRKAKAVAKKKQKAAKQEKLK
jgi:CRISPR system Cascade subunit CasA